MIAQHRKAEWRSTRLSLVGVVAVGGITLAGLAGSRGDLGFERPLPAIRVSHERTLPARLAAIDDAIAGRDMSRAVYEWRDAYGIALGTRRWDAMASVGDAAVKIDALGRSQVGDPTAFRAEARQAYLRALFDARAVGSSEGMQRVAEAFAGLGDAQMAAQARAIAGAR